MRWALLIMLETMDAGGGSVGVPDCKVVFSNGEFLRCILMFPMFMAAYLASSVLDDLYVSGLSKSPDPKRYRF